MIESREAFPLEGRMGSEHQRLGLRMFGQEEPPADYKHTNGCHEHAPETGRP